MGDEKNHKQSYDNMLHFASQLILSALKEGEMVDAIHVYGLAIDYNQFQAKIFKLSIDFTKNNFIA